MNAEDAENFRRERRELPRGRETRLILRLRLALPLRAEAAGSRRDHCVRRLVARSSFFPLQSQVESIIDMWHQKLSNGLRGRGTIDEDGVAGIGSGDFRPAFTTSDLLRHWTRECVVVRGFRSMTIGDLLTSARCTTEAAEAGRWDACME